MSLPSSAFAPVSGADCPIRMRLALTPAGCAFAPAIAAANTAAAAARVKVRLLKTSMGMPSLGWITVGVPFTVARVLSFEGRAQHHRRHVLLQVLAGQRADAAVEAFAEDSVRRHEFPGG